MSEAAGKSSRPSSNGKGSYRRRRNTSKNPKTEETTPKVEGTEAAEAPKRERPEVVPVPEELQGSTQTGTVAVTIRNRKFNFGFISLGMGEKAEDLTVPRIYYNPSNVTEKGLNLYRGYEVTFEVAKDENGRTVAQNIALTENGKAIKATRDAEAEEKKKARDEERAAAAAAKAAAAPAAAAAAAPADGAAAAKKKKSKKRSGKKSAAAPAEGAEGAAAAAPAAEKKERPPRRTATFEISVEGDASKTGSLTFGVNQSIGRLKALASKAVDASAELSVYLVTPEEPKGVFMTRAVLNSVGETGKLLLAAKRESDNLEK